MSTAEKKALNSIVFYASKSTGKRIGRLKLMKLLWLADRIHLNKYGRTILTDQYYALPKGPIASNTMNLSRVSQAGFFDVNGHLITAKSEADEMFFSKSDLEVLNYVWDEYGDLRGLELKDFSHLFPEWLRYKKELEDVSMPNSYPIIMDDFFSAPKDNVDYNFNEEESNIAKSSFLSHSAINSWLSK